MSHDHRLPAPRAEGEPSDLALDRLLAGELAGAEREAVEAAIARSPSVSARFEALRAAQDPERDARLLQAIEAALDSAPAVDGAGAAPRPPFDWRAWLRRSWAPRVAAVALAAALAVFVTRPTAETPAPAEDSVRLKGGVGLTVYRQVPRGSEVVLSGATLPAGAALRFAVDAPAAGELLVVHVDRHGALTVAHPQTGAGTSVAVPAGREQVLPSAVALDDARGEEWLFAVLCERPFSARDVAPGAAPGTLALPGGCSSAPFLIRKAAP